MPRNKAKYNARMCDYMRTYRAKSKLAQLATLEALLNRLSFKVQQENPTKTEVPSELSYREYLANKVK